MCAVFGAVFLGLADREPRAAGSEESTAPESDVPNDDQRRVPWTTSNFRGRPDPPLPFRAQRVFPHVAFKHPTVLTSAPGTDRLFVAEHDGKIYSIPPDPACTQADLLVDCVDLVERLNERQREDVPLEFYGLYGLTFHPRFSENGFCYLCYAVVYEGRGTREYDEGSRVVRITIDDADAPRARADSEVEIITWPEGGHNGGCLKFGPEGFLYISSGDGGNVYPADKLAVGQDVSNLMSTIMRIDVDRPTDDRAYAIPSDNPFVSVEGARGEIWAYGLRQPWKMSFDREAGDLWVADVGWELWEMVYRVRGGDNYGWSIMEGPQPVHTEGRPGPTPIVPPLVAIPHTEGASITGGFVYRGEKFPELHGQYLFGDWETRRIWGVSVDVEGDGVGPRREIVEPTVRVVGFAEDHRGEIYLIDYDEGTIQELVRNEVEASQNVFPLHLSDSGIFASVADHRLADGVISFSINAEMWTDHAMAKRAIAVPNTESIELYPKRIGIEGSMFERSMIFPADTVLVKTLSLEMTHGNPSSARRIETQALHYDGRDWRGYTYEWNDEQTDATLVSADGKRRNLIVIDSTAPGGQRKQQWDFATRSKCMRCHNVWNEYRLAFQIPQLNRNHDFGSGPISQVKRLRQIGVFNNAIEPPKDDYPLFEPEPHAPAEDLPRLVNPYDELATIGARGRAYLHVNCAHCHRFGGGGSAKLFLAEDLDLHELRAVDVRPTQGTFGILDARILAVGDPYRSVLYYRMAKLGPGHMPHIGSHIIDRQGLQLIHDWIRQLPVHLMDSRKITELIEADEAFALAAEAEEAPLRRWTLAVASAEKQGRSEPNDADYLAAEERAAEKASAAVKSRAINRNTLIAELLSKPGTAMLLAREVDADRMPEPIRQLVIEAAVAHDDLAVRDLYESFLPDDQRTERLGDSIRAGDILQLTGDADRGRALFHDVQSVQCRSCHRIGETGNELGPNLSEIGKRLDRAKLLESILKPSQTIDPKFQMWMVETNDGQVISGLLLKNTDQEIILNDAQNKEHLLASSDIDGLYPQRKSMMPDLLLRDFTAQQVADLLSYLESLK